MIKSIIKTKEIESKKFSGSVGVINLGKDHLSTQFLPKSESYVRHSRNGSALAYSTSESGNLGTQTPSNAAILLSSRGIGAGLGNSTRSIL